MKLSWLKHKILFGILVTVCLLLMFAVTHRDIVAQTVADLRYGAKISYGYLRIGIDSTPDVTLGNDGLFVEGTGEVDGPFRTDGAIDANSTLDVAGAATFASTAEITGNLTANGNIIGDGATQVYSTVRQLWASTANYTLVAADSGKHYDNTGAGGAITFTLPEGSTANGFYATFHVAAAQAVNIDPADATDRFISPITNAAGDKIASSTAGDYVKVLCIGDDSWVIEAAYPAATDWPDAN